MPNLKVEPRNGIFYAIGTINRKRVRQSLETRDRKQADELCAILEAKLWERAKYGEAKVRTFEEAALSYMTQGGEGHPSVAQIRHSLFTSRSPPLSVHGGPMSENTPGQLAYEADVAECPTYHDGAPRKTWAQLDTVLRETWERNPTPRGWNRNRRAPLPSRI